MFQQLSVNQIRTQLPLKHIFIGFPSCPSPCQFCPKLSDLKPQSTYIKALLKEIDLSPQPSPFPDTPLASLYFAGNSPCFYSPTSIEKILSELQTRFLVNHETQITMEIEPGAANYKKLGQFKGLGVNRVSIGVQTLSDRLLKNLNKTYTSESAKEACQMAKEVFSGGGVSVDVLLGIHSQTMEDVKSTLETILEFEPEHISPHILEKEERKKENLTEYEHSNELLKDMYCFVSGHLTQKGWDHYEVTHIAKNEGRMAVQSMAYFQNEDFLGFGFGAASQRNGNYLKRPESLENYFKFVSFLEDYKGDFPFLCRIC
jgi:oxygen-independent coproporphyrinogen III oxidase